MKITVDVPVPEGFELTGEWRRPEGESWTDGDGKVWDFYTVYPVFILRPKKGKVITFVEDPKGEWVQIASDFFRTVSADIYKRETRYRREVREE